MSKNELFPVPPSVAENALIGRDEYETMYRRSIEDPEGFWAEHGKRLDWFKPYTKVKDVSFGPGDVHVKWFHDGTLNAAYNCLDRHLETRGDAVAIIWEGYDPKDRKSDVWGKSVSVRVKLGGR